MVFLDALRVKIREDTVARNRAVYLALGVLPNGTRDVLGLWVEQTEGAKFWFKVFNDLKTRGIGDILNAAVAREPRKRPQLRSSASMASRMLRVIEVLVAACANSARMSDGRLMACLSTNACKIIE